MTIQKNKVFLGGTCPSDKKDLDYREYLIPIFLSEGLDFFNPVVDNWTSDSIRVEEEQKRICNIHLYVITSNMKGVYSIAEMFGSLIKDYGSSKKVIFVLVESPLWSEGELKSLKATGKLLKECGGYFETISSLEEIYKVVEMI